MISAWAMATVVLAVGAESPSDCGESEAARPRKGLFADNSPLQSCRHGCLSAQIKQLSGPLLIIFAHLKHQNVIIKI